MGIALAALLLASFALRTWDASQGLSSGHHFDERFTFKNVSAILKHGEYKPRHAFYLSLSYLPQTAVLGACQALYRVTRYPPFSIYAGTRDGYSPTAYWLARMVNVVYGCLSLWLLFLVGRRLYSPEVGLLAAAVLAAFSRHLMSSTEFKPDILVILLTVLTFSWTLTAAFRPALSRFLRVGLGVGLAVSTKYTGIASAIPITAAVLRNWRDRRQWLWLVLAGVVSILTFLALNPFLDVVFQFIPVLVHGYAAKGVEEKSNHWVVFERQVDFLARNHGPVVSAFVLLGVAGLLWRIYRPAPEDTEERRLGSMLALSALLGYSVLHALGMTLFRGQNYLPVVPFSSLVAGWALVETWRLLTRRLTWLARPALAAALGLGACAALIAQQASLVYDRVVPTNFASANRSLTGELGDPPGARHLVYEAALGPFQWGDGARRPLVSRVDRLTGQDPRFLDLTDVEAFPDSRLQGPDAPFYRGRLARVPKAQVERVQNGFLDRRGEPLVVVHHLWSLESVMDLRLRRPDGRPPVLVGRLPDGYYQPGDVLSLEIGIPKEAAGEDVRSVRLDPGDRTIPLFDTGRHRNRLFRTSPRFQLSAGEIRVRVPALPANPPGSFRVEINRWRPAAPQPANP